jgi:hypothetical protein
MSGLSMRRLAREIAESYRRAADSVEADLRPGDAEDTAALRNRATRSARELTRFILSRKDDPRAVWLDALEVFKEGLAGEEARQVLLVVRDIIDTWLRLSQKARSWWQDVAAATGAAPEGLDELAQAESEVNEVKAAAETMFGLLTRERPPVDPARLQQGRQEIEEGKFAFSRSGFPA